MADDDTDEAGEEWGLLFPFWGLLFPFWIDTDAYTDRDREMFVCGAEYQLICEQLKAGGSMNCPIHRENESRIRMLCGKLKRHCTIQPHEGYEGCETWSNLTVAVITEGGC